MNHHTANQKQSQEPSVRKFTDWRNVDLWTPKGLRQIDRAIAERIGYTVSDGDNPSMFRQKDHHTENRLLPKYTLDPVYPWEAFQPELQQAGWLLWVEQRGNVTIGHMGHKETYDYRRYDISPELPPGLACCLVWLQWWDDSHKSEDEILSEGGDHWLLELAQRRDVIRARVQAYDENGGQS